MKTHLIAIVAATALASGAAAAASSNAASTDAMSNKSMSNKSMSSTTQPMASDNLSLTRAQERTAWKDLSRQASNQTAPSDFSALVGATVPSRITLRSVPDAVASRVSALKPFDYARIHDKLLIVNPSDKKIVDIINRRA